MVWPFSNGKTLETPATKITNSDEYERCLKKIAERDSEIAAIKSKVNSLESDVESLRGKFNAAIRGAKAKVEELDVSEKNISDKELPFG